MTIHDKISLGKEPMPIGVGMALHLPCRIDVDDYKDLGFSIRVIADYSKSKQRIIATSVSVESDGEHEVTGTFIRTLKLREYVRKGIDSTVLIADEHGGWSAFMTPLPVMAKDTMNKNPGNNELKLLWIARVYRFAEVTNGAPAQEVAALLDVSTRTASRLVTECRDAGLLNGAS